jgi:rhodanese-related sulfurtransferase
LIKNISADELFKKMKNNEDFKLVDVLLPVSYNTWHIPGAVNMQIDEIEKKAPGLFKKDDEIIVYCASFECQASTRAAKEFERLGFLNVLDFKGGKKEWKENNFPY